MNLMANNYVISGISAITSIGANAAQTCTAANAEIIGASIHPLYRCKPLYPEDEKALPLYCNQVPFIDAAQSGAERLLQLAVPALREAVGHALVDDAWLPHTKFLLALPRLDQISAGWGLENAFVPALCQRSGVYPVASSHVIFGDRTRVFELLAEACKALDQGECDICIVGGVDSYLFKHRLDALHLNGLLRSKKNVDGLIPGEAASFIVVEREENALQRGVKPIARVSGIGFSSEINSAETGKKSSGVGLTMAIRQAATALTLPAKIVYSDLNGESYSAFEWGLAQVRTAEHLYSPFELRHPAQNYGDTGAATGALLLTLAAYDLKPDEYRKSAKYPVLLFATSITGARVAAVLTSME